MEERRQSQIPRPASGIPRLSKLPVPRGPTIRQAPSRESLTGGDLRNLRLRPAASRDSLVSSTPARKEEPLEVAPRHPPSSSFRSSRQSTGPPVSSTTPRLAKRASDAQLKRRSELGAPSPRQGSELSFSTSSRLSRRASSQFYPAASVAPRSNPLKAENPRDEPTLAASSAEDATLDTIQPPPLHSRPSLAERTMETLAQLPSSPAFKGRASASFYRPESSHRPPSRPGSQGSRPGSSYQSEGSNRPPSRQSRPGSSSEQEDNGFGFRASTNTYRAALPPIVGTPDGGRTATGKPVKTQLGTAKSATRGATAGKAHLPSVPVLGRSRTPSPEKRAMPMTTPKPVSKTLSARPAKVRASLNGLFKKPPMPSTDKPVAPPGSRKTSLTSAKSSVTSGEETIPSSASTASTAPTIDSSDPLSPGQAYRKSSAALREQIARAKAARKAASSQVSASQPADIDESPVPPSESAFDFGLPDDPFNQNRTAKAQGKVIHARVEAARTSGRLNIAALGLQQIPPEVMKMYDFENAGAGGGAWAESVDLTRFVAADNELEMIDDSIFPDKDAEELGEEEDGTGNIFGGLETLDLHGNTLICLPTGLRRLTQLTSLNLAQNRLTNNAIEVLAQIPTLRDLKLGGNLFYGPLDLAFSKIESLEILDLHGNNIESLPESFEELKRLRILNVSENNIESLPFQVLSKLPLTELVARKNKLSGSLIDDSVESLSSLQVLDVSSNQLTHLISPDSGKSIELPALQQLSVSMNRLQSLPDITSWKDLVTLTADENGISDFPEGFTTRNNLRHVDFSSNDIRSIPPGIARMDNLAMLRLGGNPLRDKKFTSASTDEIKATLAARLEPPPEPEDSRFAGECVSTPVPNDPSHSRDQGNDLRRQLSHESHDDSRSDDDFATPPTSAHGSPARSRSHTLTNQAWPVKAGGILDRTRTQSSALNPVLCSKIAAEERVWEVLLGHNLFASIPDSLSFFADTLTSLSLSHNQLVGETYLGGASSNEELALSALKELNLSNNHITSLEPLIKHLKSPSLQKLDVTCNRIAKLPAGESLKGSFPGLVVLLISNNHLMDLEPENIRGLRIVDAANNDISHLNPRIGLLGGSGGLEKLDIMGNRFRVPRWNVLERGTEATLRWLRTRVPVMEMNAWRAEHQGEDDDADDVD